MAISVLLSKIVDVLVKNINGIIFLIVSPNKGKIFPKVDPIKTGITRNIINGSKYAR